MHMTDAAATFFILYLSFCFALVLDSFFAGLSYSSYVQVIFLQSYMRKFIDLSLLEVLHSMYYVVHPNLGPSLMCLYAGGFTAG